MTQHSHNLLHIAAGCEIDFVFVKLMSWQKSVSVIIPGTANTTFVHVHHGILLNP